MGTFLFWNAGPLTEDDIQIPPSPLDKKTFLTKWERFLF